MFHGLFIDGFAGGGGASTGIEQAIGRSVDHAINHSETALAIHRANHPDTAHHRTDIRVPMLPRTVTGGQHVAGAWFSPDCKEFSKAKGGPVKDRSIRALCWEVVHWIEETDPDVGYLENVEEFEYAAPLDRHGVPIAELSGKEFKKFVGKIRATGRLVEWKKLRACDYGTPTARLRLYMVMMKKSLGRKIVWPKPTHGHPDSDAVKRGRLLPYRTAAEIIDFSIKATSIFERAKELADATKRRIAHGVMRYVVNAARPFIVYNGETFVPHLNVNRNSQKPYNGANEPTHTITAGGAHLNVVQASLISYGQHGGRNRPVDEPHHTIAASKKDTNGVVTAFLSSFYGSDKKGSGGNPEAPLRTVRANGLHHAIVTAHIEQANGGPRNINSAGRSAERPLSTVTTTGSQQRVVETRLIANNDLPPEMLDRAVKTAAFLVKYYGTDGENETAQIQPVDRPLDTVTTKARFAVVTVTIDAKTYIIVDIGLRMLTPRELARAQGFPDSYILNPVVRKFLRGKWVERPLTIAEQINAIGNSVCPPVARALVAANQPGLPDMREAA
ncbi:MAG TPA: DNA cytosine methyltransferase [Sphingobium sp.]|uniref:DNA cytosine methyltransferase n=1 Tax=Sphingobium sp. TaxID=1912891 RepID=UPI002ED68A5D